MESVDDAGVMELFQVNKKEEEYNNNNDDERKKTKVSGEIVFLPHELIEDEILVRLPGKFLMRFKWVSRRWNALFTNATFIIRHMKMQHHMERFVVFGEGYKGSIINLTSSSRSEEEVDDVVQFSLEENNNNNEKVNKYCYAYGSYKGIVCFYGLGRSPRLILWNPFTKELKHIDPPPHHINDQITPCIVKTGGIGSDPNNIRDFKIVHLIRGSGGSGLTPPSAELYTLSTGSWTSIYKDSVPVPMARFLTSLDHGIFANGICHWVYGIVTSYKCILCFDFRTNQFHTLELPPIIITTRPRYNFLCELDDSIAYAEYHDNGSPPWTDIWILDQQQQQQQNNTSCCWTKKFKFGGSVPIYTFVKSGFGFLGPSNKFLSSKEKLLRLVLYNSDGQPIRHFEQEVNARRNIYSNNIFKYKESLAPFHFFNFS